ncbi:hypothetical protein N8261_05775 [Flavobacteriaceae bacterium]|nr:hypothetical protein [Flavobacteriaceae bacterium]
MSLKQKRHTFLEGRSRGDAKHDFKELKKVVDALESPQFQKGLPPPPTGTGNSEEPNIWNVEIKNFNQLFSQNQLVGEKLSFKEYMNNASQNNILFTPLITSPDIETNTYYGITKLENIRENKNTGNFTLTEGATTPELTAAKFLTDLGIENNAAFVIDAASVSILKILKTGDASGDKTNIFYVMAPEITNDPAGKPSCKEVQGLNSPSNNKIKITPIIEMNSGQRTYTYAPDHTDSFQQFFSKYSFTLSGLQTNKSLLTRKSYHYNNLTVTDDEFAQGKTGKTGKTGKNDYRNDYSVTINESKKQNNITSLLSSLSSLINKIFTRGTGSTNVDTFNMNREFQQKRAGDWLQVLLCKNLLSRKMAEFDSFSTGVDTNQSITNNISEVWFVTHDIIALTFALYSGVNCIFTNVKDVYAFKIPNEAAELDYQNGLLVALEGEMEKIDIGKYTKRITAYNNNRTNQLRELYLNSTTRTRANTDPITNYKLNDIFNLNDNDRNRFFPIPSESTSPNNDIDLTIKQIFKLAYKYSYTASFFPDLSVMGARMRTITGDIDSTYNLANTNRDNIANIAILKKSVNKLTGLIGEYNDYISTIDKYGGIATVGIGWKPDDLKVPAVGIANRKKYPSFQIELQPSYKLIDKFSWQTVQFNMRQFLASFGDKNYKMDSCIYLYDMKYLSDKIKEGIITTFYNYDVKLGTNVVDLNPQQKKMHYVMKGFCQSVYMGIGGFANDTTMINNVEAKVKAYNTYISSNSKISDVDTTYLKVADDNCVYENNTFNKLISDKKIENDYIYGDVIGVAATKQQKISNLCAIDSDTGSYTSLLTRNQKSDCNIKNDNEIEIDNNILNEGAAIEETMTGGAGYTADDLILESISNSNKQVIYSQLGGFLENRGFIMNFGFKASWYNLFSSYDNYSELFEDDDGDSMLGTINNTLVSKTATAVVGAATAVGVAIGLYLYYNQSNELEPHNGGKSIGLIGGESSDSTETPEASETPETSETPDSIETSEIPESTESPETTETTTPKGSTTDKMDFIDYVISKSKLKDDPEKIQLVKKSYNDMKDTLPFNLYFMGFHPMLPLYVLLQGMYDLTSDHIEDSLDYELVVRYFHFLKKMNKEMRKIYETNVSNTMDEAIVRQFASYIIGQAINAMIIDLDLMRVKVNTKYYVETGIGEDKLYIDKFLDMTDDQYFSIQLLGKNLSGDVVGSSPDIVIDDNIGLLLQNPIVTTYFKNVDVKSIFYDDDITMPESIDVFQKMVYDELKETGEQIIKGRRETTLSPISSLSSVSPNTPTKLPCSTGKYKRYIKDGNIIKVCDENALVPFSGKNIRTWSDIRRDDKSPGDVSVESTLSSNSSSRSRGGKNTRNKKTKKTKKNKRKGKKGRTNRKNSRTSNKRKSKRKIAKKKIRRITKKVGKK